MMCFDTGDYDWCASVTEKTPSDSGKACRCDECGRDIAENEWRLAIHQQEHDSCQICEDEFSDEFISREEMESEVADGDEEWAQNQIKFLDEHKHDYGETFDYVRCRGCDHFLKAIEDREAKEGCPPDARQPYLCALREEMSEHYQARDYADHAVAMFPDLQSHPIIRDIFERTTYD